MSASRCGALVNNRDGLCPLHLAQHRQQVNARRGITAERGYTGAWRKARAAYLRAHPLCECDECKALGRVLPATVVDHIKPHRGDMSLFWDRTNWQAMSKPCHDRKRARYDAASVDPAASCSSDPASSTNRPSASTGAAPCYVRWRTSHTAHRCSAACCIEHIYPACAAPGTAGVGG